MECFSIDVKEIKGRIDPLFYFSIYRENEQIIKSSKWSVKRLAEISSKIVDGPFGSQLKVEEYVEKGVPLIRVKNIKNGQLDESGLTYITSEKQEQLKRSKVYSGDILLTKAGSIGNAAILPSHIKEANITSHLAKIEPVQGINSKYLCEYLNTSYAKLQITRLGSKTTRPELNLSEVSSILVIIPTEDIQNQVVELMQAAYQLKRQKEAEAQNLLNSIDEYVLGELGIEIPVLEEQISFSRTAESLQHRRIDVHYHQQIYEQVEKAIAKSKYPTVKLYETFDSELVRGILPTEKEGKKKVLQIRNIGIDGLLNFNDIAQSDYHFNKGLLIEKGDIILVITGATIGKVGLWDIDDEFYLGGDMIKFKPNKDFDCYYIQAFLLSVAGQMQILRHITGATNKHLAPSDIKLFNIPKPHLELQKGIGQELKQITHKVKALRQQASNEIENKKIEVENLILST